MISFAPNVHAADAVAGGRASGMAGHINKWISNGRGQLTLGVASELGREILLLLFNSRLGMGGLGDRAGADG